MKWFSLLFIALAACSSPRNTTDTQNSEIHQLISAQNFVFEAQSVMPARGSARQLSPGYDLQVTPGLIAAYLPYFGRAYSAPMDPSNAGIHFTSKKFNYNLKDRKKGGWLVSIQPLDNSDTRQLNLTVFSNGSASLQVTSNYREPITFNGQVREKKMQ